MSAPNSQLHDCSCFFRSIQVIVHCTAMQHIYWDVCCCAMENGPYNRTESSIWLINETTWNISYAQHGRCMDFFVRFVLVFYGFGNSRGQPAEWMVNFHSKRYTFYLAIIAFGWCDERVEPPTLFFFPRLRFKRFVNENREKKYRDGISQWEFNAFKSNEKQWWCLFQYCFSFVFCK